MKRTYIQPQIQVAIIGTTAMICGSKDVYSDKGIEYGGIDEGGEKDPESRRYNTWNDVEDEEE